MASVISIQTFVYMYTIVVLSVMHFAEISAKIKKIEEEQRRKFEEDNPD